MRTLNQSLLALLLLFLTGCFAHVQHLPKADPTKPSFPVLSDEPETLVGVAMSGGGSRAAYFGAAGLEELAKLQQADGQPSVLEQVSHLSSVSGGSLASSYFATHKPKAGVSTLRGKGTLTPEYQTFFEHYSKMMGKNYVVPLLWRQFWNVRWFNSNQRATSLAEVLDANFLNK